MDFVDETVRGRIERDDEEFGQMLMGFEGWQFKFEVFERSDDEPN
jgi:hypothetical protein